MPNPRISPVPLTGDAFDRCIIRARNKIDSVRHVLDRAGGAADLVAAAVPALTTCVALRVMAGLAAGPYAQALVSGLLGAIFLAFLLHGAYLAIRYPHQLWALCATVAGLVAAASVVSTATIFPGPVGLLNGMAGPSLVAVILMFGAYGYGGPAIAAGIIYGASLGVPVVKNWLVPHMVRSIAYIVVLVLAVGGPIALAVLGWR